MTQSPAKAAQQKREAVVKCCAICDGTKYLRDGHGKGGLNDVCRPCFCVWYDDCPPREDGKIHAEDIRRISLEQKEKGTGMWGYLAQQSGAHRKDEA